MRGSAALRASRATSRWSGTRGSTTRGARWAARARVCVPADPRCSSAPRGSPRGAGRRNGALAEAAAVSLTLKLKRGAGRQDPGPCRTTGRCIYQIGTGAPPGEGGWACQSRAGEYQRTSSSGPLCHSSSFSSTRAFAAGTTPALRRLPRLKAIVANQTHGGVYGALRGSVAICDCLGRRSARANWAMRRK